MATHMHRILGENYGILSKEELTDRLSFTLPPGRLTAEEIEELAEDIWNVDHTIGSTGKSMLRALLD